MGPQARLTDDLDVAEPGARPPPGAERLEHGLLGGEQTSDVLHHGVAVALAPDLAGAADPLEETLAMAGQQHGEALELDQVEADAEDAGGGAHGATASDRAALRAGDAGNNR